MNADQGNSKALDHSKFAATVPHTLDVHAAPAMRLTGSRSHAAEVMRVVVTKTDVIGNTKIPGHRMHRCCLKSYCVDHQSKRRQVGGRL